MSRDDLEQAIYERTRRFVDFDVLDAILELIAAEREACAKVCEDDKTQAMEWTGTSCPGGHFASAIRSRKQA